MEGLMKFTGSNDDGFHVDVVALAAALHQFGAAEEDVPFVFVVVERRHRVPRNGDLCVRRRNHQAEPVTFNWVFTRFTGTHWLLLGCPLHYLTLSLFIESEWTLIDL